MALTYSDAIAHARLDAVESVIGASAIMKIRTGAAPATVATGSTGTVVATLALPADWMNAAAARKKTKSGTWQDAAADAAGTAAHFEICDNGGTVHARGSVTATGGGGDVQVDNVVFAAGQQFTITSFELVHGN